MIHRPINNSAHTSFAFVDYCEMPHSFIDTFAERADGFHLLFSAFNGADLLDGPGQLERLFHLCILDLYTPVMDALSPPGGF